MIGARTVRIDGYAGLDWDHLRLRLSAGFRAAGIKTLWYETKAFLKPENEIDELIAPFLGTPGSVWGTKATLSLADFYTPALTTWQPNEDADLIILAGTGAGLSAWQAPVVYIDLPKNELQYRMRAGSATNLGSSATLGSRRSSDSATQPGSTANPDRATNPNSMPDADSAPTPDNPVGASFAEMYKRCYFVDWVLLNRHRQAIKDSIVLIADGQWDTDINWALSASLEKGLHTIAENVIRNRPWFEPGVWGGQWLKGQIPTLSRDEINYAWSFELIAPENGLVFESDGYLLEISFDWLMETAGDKVLGADFHRFGLEFPIRFDFLDTVDGGNLSIQCHPSLDYIRDNFGETITQDETYYILDRKGDAGVYLGFQENIDPGSFRQALELSQQEKTAIDIEKFVQRLPAARHDLFLIPNRTVHGAGIGNLVLEISATPYIFTFKMYDWMRLDLDGQPRPINIEHAFRNLDFSRKGKKVQKELISQPVIIKEEEGLLLELLPTHPEHFYGVHRLSLTAGKKTWVSTEGKCHLLMLVEGTSVLIRTAAGREWQARYAETFVLPAAAGSYELINTNHQPLKLVKAFVK
jgi:mannose-6-phosphate isomerase class I